MVEQTSKEWKKAKLAAIAFFLMGVLLMLGGLKNNGWESPITSLGAIAAIIGIVAVVVSDLGAWWNHK